LVLDLVARKGAEVCFYDPFIAEVTDVNGKIWKGIELTDDAIALSDCIVFTTNHSCFNVSHIVEMAKLVVDTRNAVKSVSIEDDKVFKL
jgi:UDP-N-acetyl-D-glucosamine dehydrogenase